MTSLLKVWAHWDSNPGSSPCKGDVITNWTMSPAKFLFRNHLNFERLNTKIIEPDQDRIFL